MGPLLCYNDTHGAPLFASYLAALGHSDSVLGIFSDCASSEYGLGCISKQLRPAISRIGGIVTGISLLASWPLQLLAFSRPRGRNYCVFTAIRDRVGDSATLDLILLTEGRIGPTTGFAPA